MIKIAMYDLEGYLLETFETETYKDLEKKLNISYGGLHSCVNNKQHQINNRQFRELKGSRVALKKIGDVSSLVNGSTEYVTILKKYNGKVISSYHSIKEACYKNNLKQSNLSDHLNGNTRNCGGFEWVKL